MVSRWEARYTVHCSTHVVQSKCANSLHLIERVSSLIITQQLERAQTNLELSCVLPHSGNLLLCKLLDSSVFPRVFVFWEGKSPGNHRASGNKQLC